MDTWSEYWDTIEQYLIANGIDDNKKRTATFLTLIGKETYSILHSLTAPEKPSSKKVEELNVLLGEHFEPKPIVIAERYKFYSRVQQADEPLSNLVADIRKLAIHCDFENFLGQALRDKFVCGLHDAGIRKRLLTEKKLNFSTAVSVAKTMESAQEQSKGMESGLTIPTHAVKQSYKKRRCFRCDSDKHLANECIHKATECNHCGIKGHLRRVCRRAKQCDRSNRYTSDKKREEHSPTQCSNNNVESSSDHGDKVGAERDNEDEGVYYMHKFQDRKPIVTTLKLMGRELQFEIDTRASVK